MKFLKIDHSNLLIILIFLTFIKGILWMISVPVWGGPDEPAHFGYAQYISQTGRIPQHNKPFISKGIVYSIKILQIDKINFNPNQTFNYSSYTNTSENKIKNLPKIFSQQYISWAPLIVHPPAYYLLLAVLLKSISNLDILTQVFILRFLSIIFFLLTVYFSYLTSRNIFKKNQLLQIIIPTFVSFQPMMTFVGSIINNDNLLVLTWSIVFYIISNFYLNKKISLVDTLFLSVFTSVSLITKSQSIMLIPPIILTYFFIGKSSKNLKKIILEVFLFIVIISITAGSYYLNIFINQQFLTPLDSAVNKHINLDNLKYYLIPTHRLETIFNFYWGTFGWLDTRLPSIIYGIFLILSSLSFMGLILKFYKIKKKGLSNLFSDTIGIFVLSVIILFLFLLGYDIFSMLITDKPWMQGRYLLPVIIPSMILFAIGLKEITKFKRLMLLLASTILISLNTYSLFFAIIPRYYGHEINLWIVKLSQNKPDLLKGNFIVLVTIIYLITTIIYLKKLFGLPYKISKKT